MNYRKKLRLQCDQITIADLVKPIEEYIECSYMLWPDGGYFNGSSSTLVNGVLLTWMAGLEAIQRAVAEQCTSSASAGMLGRCGGKEEKSLF